MHDIGIGRLFVQPPSRCHSPSGTAFVYQSFRSFIGGIDMHGLQIIFAAVFIQYLLHFVVK
jgi:hypothetical protein